MRLVTTRFWRVLLGGIGVSVCMLLGSQLSTSHAQPPQVAIAQQVQTLKSQGKADDIIPVIIQLQDPITINEGINPTTLDKSVRMRAVAQQTAGFVQRNQAVFRSIKGSTKSTAIVFAQVMRSNLDVLLNDKQIMAVTLDEPQPPSLSESIDMIDSRAAVVAGYDGSGTSVVILDTGVDKNHVFLSGQVIAEACFSSTITINGTSSTSLCPGGVSTSVAPDSGLPCPDTLIGCGHGTHVAGIIAGKRQNPPLMSTYIDSKGVPHTSEIHGVAPGTKIIAVKVFSQFPAATCGTTKDCAMSWSSDQIAALDWVYANAKTPSWGTLAAINMSLGSGGFSSFCDTNAIKRPIDLLRSIGVATVIASGNSGYINAISTPACVSSAIAVGASVSNRQGYVPDTVASFSNAPLASQNQPNSNGDRLLDVMAPGLGIISSYAFPANTNAYVRMSGTSMATPHVVGAWAILKGVSPAASVKDILSWFTATGVAIDANSSSAEQVLVPRLDVNAAVALARNPNTIATQTAQANATDMVRQTATAQVQLTQTAVAAVTQTVATNNTATSIMRQTATSQAQQTQTAIAQPTQTAAAQATQTMASIRTATMADQQTATKAAQQTATDSAMQTQTVVAQATRTAAMALTQTAVAQRQTDTAVAYITRTAVIAITQTDSAARSATAIMGRTQTAEIVNPTNTAIMALTRTAASDLTQTAYVIRTATAIVQQTSTAIQRQTDTAVAIMTRTAVAALTQTDSAARSATAIMGRTQTAEIVNPTNTAIMALTRTAASDLTQTAVAQRQTDTAVAYITRTAVAALTQTDSAARSATAIMGRTQTAEIVNPTNTAIMALTRTAASDLTQTAYAARTATVAVQQTATSIANQTNTALAIMTRTAAMANTQTAIIIQNTALATARTATVAVQQTATSDARLTATAMAAIRQTSVIQRTAQANIARTATAAIVRAAKTQTAVGVTGNNVTTATPTTWIWRVVSLWR